MSIFDIFRGGANPNAVQKNAGINDPMNPQNPNLQQQNNQQPAPQNTQQADPSANPQNNNPQNKTEGSPEDLFKDFWKTDPNNKAPQDLAEFNFNFDPAKVDQQVSQMDFTKVITPELVSKMANGGQDAVSAFMTAMNLVGQQATKTALLASTKVTETGLRSTGQRLKDTLPSFVREHTVSNALREDNPLFTDPTTAPVFAAIESEFTKRFPTATAQEIRENAKQYFARFAENAAKFSGKTVTDGQPQQTLAEKFVQTDWSKEPT